MTDAYGSLRISAIFSAILLLTLLHSVAIPPLVKTRGSEVQRKERMSVMADIVNGYVMTYRSGKRRRCTCVTIK